jgi:hypothetical protein
MDVHGPVDQVERARRARGISREGESQDVIDRSHLCRSVHDRALLEHGIIIIIITDAFNSLSPTPRPDDTESKHTGRIRSVPRLL